MDDLLPQLGLHQVEIAVKVGDDIWHLFDFSTNQMIH